MAYMRDHAARSVRGINRDAQCLIVSRFLRDKGEQYQCDTEFEWGI